MATQISVLAAAGTEGGGAALDQVLGMSVATGIITAGLLWIGYLHRQRRITWLQNLAETAGRKMNRPSWVALPSLLFISTIICAMFGFIWDVSLHIGKGRDAGPLANPAHYFILVGLFLLFIAGSLSIILPYDKPGPAAIKITKTWYAPVGGILMAGCGLYALIGFPLDDIWHRIFGQDVTLWGPTHLMLIGGAGLSLVAMLLLEREGDIAMGADAPPARNKVLPYFAFGGLVIGLSVFPVEYDFGVEQFRLVLHPMLIAAAASMSLVATRLTLGRYSTFGAIAFALFIRGLVALAVGPILGSPYSWCALYLGSAIVIELIGLTPLADRPILFGAVAGLGVGTIGMWLESFWVDAMFRIPWPTSMWGEALSMSTPVAMNADALWDAIGRFAAIGDWHPMIEKVDAEGEQKGSVRTLQLIGGAKLVERLEEISPTERLYRYSILESPLPSLLSTAIGSAAAAVSSDLSAMRQALHRRDLKLRGLYASSHAPHVWQLIAALGPLTRAELARALEVTPRTASLAVVALESANLVRLRPADKVILSACG